jgi:hypothetical protein
MSKAGEDRRLERLVAEGRQLRMSLHIAVVEATMSVTASQSPSFGIAAALVKMALGSRYMRSLGQIRTAARVTLALTIAFRSARMVRGAGLMRAMRSLAKNLFAWRARSRRSS